MRAMSRRQRRKTMRRLEAEVRFLQRRWEACARLYEAAEKDAGFWKASFEKEQKAKYAEMLVIPDANVARGTVRIVTRIR